MSQRSSDLGQKHWVAAKRGLKLRQKWLKMRNSIVRGTSILTELPQNRRAIRGACGAFAPPEIFKSLHSTFDICKNFQKIKMKFHILIIFKKSYWNFCVSY